MRHTILVAATVLSLLTGAGMASAQTDQVYRHYYEKFCDDYLASGIAGSFLVTTWPMAAAAVEVLKALKTYPPGTSIPGNGRGDPVLNVAWHNWEDRFLDTETYGTNIRRSPNDITAYSTPDLYRFALRMEASITKGGIEGYYDAWKKGGGCMPGDPPGYSPDILSIFDAIERMDPKSGHIDGDVPERLRATQ